MAACHEKTTLQPELTSMMNIGEKLEKRLSAVEIYTAEQLKTIGSKEAFFRLKQHDPSVCTVYLYALEGAISGIEYNQLPEDVKQDLKNFSDNFK